MIDSDGPERKLDAAPSDARGDRPRRKMRRKAAAKPAAEPHWERDERHTGDKWRSHKGLTLLEIANQAVDSNNEGDAAHPSTEQLWDMALSRGARLFGTATDDAHHYDDAGRVRARGEFAYVRDRGFVMVRANKQARSIREAIERGDFYASTGVVLERLDLSREVIAIDVATPRAGPITFEVVGNEVTVLRWVQGRSLRFSPREHPSSYWRVRVSHDSGQRAWTQPVWDLQPPTQAAALTSGAAPMGTDRDR